MTKEEIDREIDRLLERKRYDPDTDKIDKQITHLIRRAGGIE